MLLTTEDRGAEYERRCAQMPKFEDPTAQALAKEFFAQDICEWVDDWAVAYDPRDLDLPDQPFHLFDRQRDLVLWMQELVEEKAEGVLEKSRDVGASWIMALFALNRFLFVPGFKTTYGSYTADKVDKIGDPDSWFEKIRIAMSMLPRWQWPEGFDRSRHDNDMRLVNPENGNTIVGGVGKQLGRGGRSTLAIIDEGAFLEYASEAFRAIAANADTKLYASTANGMANTFYIKRCATLARAPARLFRLHWRDDPRKDDAWAAAKRAEMEPEDWAAEHDIDYGASTERQLIKVEWVEASRELGRLHGDQFADSPRRCGLDVGAGKAESSLATLEGQACVLSVKSWRDPDAVDTAALALETAREFGAKVVNYDATGVGFSQGAIMQRMGEEIALRAINLGDPPHELVRINEGDRSVQASERFANQKALGWWQLRERAQSSWKFLYGPETKKPPLSDCLLLTGRDPVLDAQLCQPTWSKNLRGKRQVDKAPNGAKSPDRADAVVLAMIEAPKAPPVVW